MAKVIVADHERGISIIENLVVTYTVHDGKGTYTIDDSDVEEARYLLKSCGCDHVAVTEEGPLEWFTVFFDSTSYTPEQGRFARLDGQFPPNASYRERSTALHRMRVELLD